MGAQNKYEPVVHSKYIDLNRNAAASVPDIVEHKCICEINENHHG